MGVTKAEGIIPMQERLIGEDISRYKVVRRNWFAYNPMRLNIGSIARWPNDSDILVSPDYVVFRCLEEPGSAIDPEYLDHFRRSDQWEGFVTESGIGSVRVRIYYNDIARLQLKLPPLAEQKKIAECLTTLNEVIAAQSQKLNALKTHKKGLMQQLFPRQGETIPRLRFPEFQDSPEWESDSLGKIFETTSGGTPSRSEKSYWGGNIPWITTSLVNFRVITEAEEFISEEGLNNSASKLFPEGTVLIAMYGQGKTRGQVALLGIEAATNQACAAILPQKGIEPYFVFLNLVGRYQELRDLSNSGGQENLTQGLIRGIPFSYPTDVAEQKTIAACLSSLDELIAAQSAKLDALKSHKKGLMQQLFPSPEDVEA